MESVKSECRPLIHDCDRPGRDVDGRGCAWRWVLYLGLILLGALDPRTVAGAGSGGTLGEDPEGRWLIQNWQTEDGLPENSATSVVQTADGFLWIGTFNGLVRFDGVTFRVYDRANTPELPHNGIVNLHLDRDGRLWVSTLRGLVVRHGSTWSRIRPDEGQELGPVRTFSERSNGDLLLTLFDGPIYQWVSNRLERLPTPPGRSDRGYLGLADASGAWWVVQGDFVGRWESGQWRSMMDPSFIPEAGVDQVACAVGLGGRHWILRRRVLIQFQGAEVVGRVELDQNPGPVWNLMVDRAGGLWIGSYVQGLMEVDPSGRVRRWQAPDMLPSNSVRVMFEDREANLWIGTNGGGLTRFKRRRVQGFGVEDGIVDRSSSSVSADSQGRVWVGSFGQGLMLLDGQQRMAHRDPAWSVLTRYVHCVQVDRADRVWVGVYNRGVWCRSGDAFVRFPLDATVSTNVTALFEDRQGGIWVAGGRGAGVIRDGRLQSFGPEHGLPAGGIRGFGEDGQGAIWVAHAEGVFRLRDDRFEPVPIPGSGDRELPQVQCFLPDTGSGLWMGTSHDGLLHWREGRVRRIGPSEGLPDAAIHGMVEDGAGCLWLGTRRGIVRVRVEDLEAHLAGATHRIPCQLLDRSDGMPGAEVPAGRQPVCGRDRQGRIWFATSRGVAAVRPGEFQINPAVPRTVIEDVTYEAPTGEAGTQPVEMGQVPRRQINAPLPDPVTLPRGTRRLEIRFTAPSLVAAEKVRFQINLDEDDSGWRDVGNRRSAFFEGLKPGWHRFRVRACNNDGVWDEPGASLRFHVPAQFWQTAGFQVLVGSAIVAEAGLLVGLVWVQRRRRRAEVEVQLQRLELSHLSRVMAVGELTSSLAHELNHPQSAILSNAQAGELFLASQPPALDEVRRIFADIVRDTRRANGIIQRLRSFLQKRDLELEPVDLEVLVRETLVLVDADARARQVTVSLEPPGPLPRARADRIHLQQVLLNLMLNALDALESVPAGPAARQVVVSIRERDPGTLEVRVRDTGPGIPPEKLARVFEPFFTTKPKGMGLGLSLARTLVETLGGRIHAENTAEGGAVFVFTLPVAKRPNRHE